LPATTLQANRRVADSHARQARKRHRENGSPAVLPRWDSIEMQGYRPQTYGDEIAEVYDEWLPGGFSEQAALDTAGFLADLVPGGRALELGIGTGRVALPLAARGVEVHGIDASESMVAKLRAKPGGEDLPVTIGDFADVPVDVPAGGEFDLVYVVFNTFFALLTQEDQLRCAGNVAARLRPGGRFVIEAFVPDLCRFHREQLVGANLVGLDRVRLEVSQHDRLTQTVSSQHVMIGTGGIQLAPVRLRYCWPSELNLICRLADLHLTDRYGGWRREPFTSASGSHVSVYTKA
jgi:SAM-dependent methyltransferase